MCILIMIVLVLSCSDKNHSEIALILILKASNIQGRSGGNDTTLGELAFKAI